MSDSAWVVRLQHANDMLLVAGIFALVVLVVLMAIVWLDRRG